jgi:hypothetical protein
MVKKLFVAPVSKNQFSFHLLSKEKKNKRTKKEQAIEEIADRHSKVSYSD